MQRLAGLNLTPRIDPSTGRDANPCTMPEAILYKETLTLGSLDIEELETFKAQFGALLAAPGSEERRVMLDRLSAYVIGLRAIKHELDNVKFRGLNPEDTELGFGHIRPQFTRANAAYRRNWNQLFVAAATWYDWFWETAGNAHNIGQDFGLVITHLKSLVTPTPYMSECRFVVGRTGILIPIDTRNLIVGDNENQVSLVPCPTMVLKPRSTFYGRCETDTGGVGQTDQISLGGIIVGLGRALRQEVPTWT